MTVRIRCGWAKSMECGELLYGRGSHIKLKGVVYKSCLKPAIL